MADDPLDTNPVVVAPPRPGEPRQIVCSACGCTLARSGEVLATGETYKKFLKHDQILEAKDREISALTAEVSRLKEEVAQLKVSAGAPSHQHRPGGRIL